MLEQAAKYRMTEQRCKVIGFLFPLWQHGIHQEHVTRRVAHSFQRKSLTRFISETR